ncbi:MAG: TonB-dependent receptor, partial [Acidobacteria bacterium]|nr:TonB-dependent receptor [Acidobacteriota bacterium]
MTVETQDARVSTVVDRQFVENLPLSGRSFQSLVYLTPGVVPTQIITGPVGTNMGGFVVNGQRGDANYWTVDGVSANFASTVGSNLGPGVAGSLPATNVVGGTNGLVAVDALQEFRIQTSSYAPEFGRSPGGQISIQTRSGTNRFHGTAFNYFRNGVMDAADWFANANRLTKPIVKQNNFGGVIGGPIIKDKTFFFFSYEGFRLKLPYTFLGTVPTLAARQGAIPAMQPYVNAYPLPAPGAVEVSLGIAPYGATYSNPASADAYSIRVDHQVANNLNLFGRYNQSPSSANERGTGTATANNVCDINISTKTATVGTTWTISPEIVNDARFNYSSHSGNAGCIMDTFGGGTDIPAESIFPSPFTYENGWMAINTFFGSNMRFNPGMYDPLNSMQQYNAVDTLTMQKGRHGLKFGVDYRHMLPFFGFAQYLSVPFFGSMSDMQAGNNVLIFVLNSARVKYSFHNLSLFGQDTWRVNPRLNLTYGLRWDVDFSPRTTFNENILGVTGFSLTDYSNLALAPAGTPPYSTRYGNVAPRIGAAYQLSQNPDWGLVLRGGFGVFYGLVNTEIGSTIGAYYPQGGYTIFFGVPFPSTPEVAALPPIAPPSSTYGTLLAFDPHLNAPYALEWNVALQQSLGKAQTFSVSYIGASNKRMLARASISNPNPNYGSAELFANTGTASYNALQAQYRRALVSGLQALVSYSWSHSIDTGSYGAYANGSLADVNVNRGSSDYDIRHALSAALTYQVPGVKSNRLARAITGGWSFHNIVQILSGAPVDVLDATYSALTQQLASAQIRPDIVPGQPLYLSGPQYPGGKALNPAAFTHPPVDSGTGLPIRQGNLTRNSLRAPGLAQWDFAVHREFPIHEAVKLQFRAELFNVLNHPNFGLFETTFQPGNIFFGQSTAMRNQLGGRLGWGIQSSL